MNIIFLSWFCPVTADGTGKRFKIMIIDNMREKLRETLRSHFYSYTEKKWMMSLC